nr:phosphatase PAP2 family protein [uncultured Gellertiella sp.]
MTDQIRRPGQKPGFFDKLRNRRARFASRHPAIAWKGWLASTLLLVALAVLVLDRPVIHWVATEPAWLRALAARVTDTGKSGWILVSSAILGIAFRLAGRHMRPRRWRHRSILLVQSCLYVFVSVAGSGLLSNLIKRAAGRARPMHIDDLGTLSFHPFANGYDFESFPSGHSTTDGALAMALALLFPALRLPLLALGLALAITRILVGAHYPSDVIAGFSFGAWFALMMALVFARNGLLFRNGTSRWPRR